MAGAFQPIRARYLVQKGAVAKVSPLRTIISVPSQAMGLAAPTAHCATCVAESPEAVASPHRIMDRASGNLGCVARQLEAETLTPTTVLVDKRGSVTKRNVTAPDVAAWHQLIDKLLADS